MGRDPDGYLFVAPALVGFTLFALAPLLLSIALVFLRWDGFGTPTFVGFGNLERFLVADTPVRALFYAALWRNILLAAVVMVGTIVIALPLAIALNAIRRGGSVVRTVFLLPIVTSGIAVFYVWVFVFAEAGPVNGIFDALGIDALAPRGGWLASPGLAIWGIAVVAIWGTVPWAVLFYLAGLQAIDPALYETADIDGAGWLQQLRYITWPLLNNVTVILVILLVVNLLQSYETVFLMTNGGPGYHTYVVGLVSYNLAYGNLTGMGGGSALGMAAAIGWVLFFVFSAFALMASRILRDRT